MLLEEPILTASFFETLLGGLSRAAAVSLPSRMLPRRVQGGRAWRHRAGSGGGLRRQQRFTRTAPPTTARGSAAHLGRCCVSCWVALDRRRHIGSGACVHTAAAERLHRRHAVGGHWLGHAPRGTPGRRMGATRAAQAAPHSRPRCAAQGHAAAAAAAAARGSWSWSGGRNSDLCAGRPMAAADSTRQGRHVIGKPPRWP